MLATRISKQARTNIPSCIRRGFRNWRWHGLNFEFYDFDKVSSVRGIDPAISSLEIAKRRIIEMNIPVEVMEGSAEAINFEDNTFDSVVVGYSLCTIPDPIKDTKKKLKRSS